MDMGRHSSDLKKVDSWREKSFMWAFNFVLPTHPFPAGAIFFPSAMLYCIHEECPPALVLFGDLRICEDLDLCTSHIKATLLGYSVMYFTYSGSG